MTEEKDCIFCKIVKKDIPSNPIYEDDKVYAFYDLQPQAPYHFLVVPKKHLDSLEHINDEDKNKEIIGYLLSKIPDIAKMVGIKNGYRVVNNIGADGLQTVKHIHFHVLGGRKLTWPPG
ncbi:MAG: histidine triad nucleotide-binding protein [Clostridiales Family XIII bacterium]|jgi:diadenosine tetraphosphate (Ap4A) HIT family hydrolase|nr:histidine triad nucleotide-binding protein [Clostridiales Family XIII bacterium]